MMTEEDLQATEAYNAKTRLERQGTASQWHIATVKGLCGELREAYVKHLAAAALNVKLERVLVDVRAAHNALKTDYDALLARYEELIHTSRHEQS